MILAWLLDKVESLIDRWPSAGPILVFFVLLAFVAALVSSRNRFGQALCASSFVVAVAFAVAATYFREFPPPPLNPHQKFETTWAIEDPCHWGFSQIARIIMPLSTRDDITAYKADDYDNSELVVLLSSQKPLVTANIGPIILSRTDKAAPELKFCINNLQDAVRIQLLPTTGDPSQCANKSERELAQMSLVLSQILNSGERRPVCR